VFSRLATAWGNWRRAIVSLRQGLFRKSRPTEQEVETQPSQVAKQTNDRPVAPAGAQESGCCPDCMRTQNQKLEAMLKLMISPPVGRLIMAQPGETVKPESDTKPQSPADRPRKSADPDAGK